MEALTPVMMVDMVNTVVMPGVKTHKHISYVRAWVGKLTRNAIKHRKGT